MIALIATAVLSQAPCASAEAAARMPGFWQKQHDELANADPTFPKTQWPVVLSHSDKVVELLEKALPAPVGLSVAPSRVLPGRSMLPNGPVPHGIEVPIFDVYCEQGRQKAADETGTWIYIEFNSLSWLSHERMQTGLSTRSGATIFRVPAHHEDLHGSHVFKPDVHNERSEEAVVFTRDGSSPYKLISRSTWLEARIAKQQAFIDEVLKRKGVQQKYVDEITGNKRQLEQALAALSPEEHHEAAIVKDFNALPPKPLFTTLEEGGHKLATLERKHFEPSGARDGMQLVTAYWSFNEKKPAHVEMVKQLKERFDWEALKKMVQP